jgi:hypothetical protein
VQSRSAVSGTSAPQGGSRRDDVTQLGKSQPLHADEANYVLSCTNILFFAVDAIDSSAQPDAVNEIYGLMADFARELHLLLGNLKM